MRLLLTRPEEDATALADELSALGHSVVLAPMMRVRFVDGMVPDLDGVQAVLLTSANGARALARATGVRDVRVLTVGAATAAAARAAGFTDVESADGDVTTLAALVRRRCQPADGALLHVSGHDVAGDLAGALGDDGFEVRRSVLYRATAVDRLPDAARTALEAGDLDGVLLFSPRTATIFSRLLQGEKLETACRNLDIYALSKAVAAAAIVLPWRGCYVAARPMQADLVDLLRQGTAMGEKDDKTSGEPWGRAETDDAAPLQAAEVDPADAPAEADTTVDVEASEPADAAAGTIDAEPLEADAAGDDAATADKADPTDFGEPTEEVAPARKRSGAGTLWIVLSLIVVIAGVTGYFAWPQISDRLAGPAATVDLDADLTALTQRLDRLEQADRVRSEALSQLRTALAALEAVGGEPRDDVAKAADVAALQARIDTLDGKLDTMLAAPPAGDAAPSPELVAQLEALTARVDALASRPAPTPGVPPEAAAALAAAQQALATARDERATLVQQNAALNGQVRQLTQRLAVLEQRAAAAPAGDRREALVLAVGQLRTAALAGTPYAGALESFVTLAGDDAELAAAVQPLQAHQATGLVTPEALRRRYADMARAVMQAGDSADAGLVDRTIQRLSNLVVVRRTGDVAGDEPDAILARAEQRLAAGDLTAAVSELESLDGLRGEAAAVWLGDARARLAAEEALAALQARAIQAVAGG